MHRYTLELARLLPGALPGTDLRLRYFQFLWRDRAFPEALEPWSRRPVRWIPGRVYFRLMRHGLEPRLHFDEDLVVYPNFTAWRAGPARALLAVHDLSFLRLPEHTETSNRDFLTRTLPRSLERAQGVLVLSEFTRRELAELTGYPPERVTVAPPPLPLRYRQVAEGSDPGGSPLAGERPYLLVVGTLEPRKNLEGLLRAFRQSRAGRDRTVRLVLAGGPGWHARGIEAAIASAQADGFPVEVQGFLPEADLPGAYAGALALVFPSHYEGYGLPVIEAMACGCPVIATEVSAIPEAAGGAALLVPRADDGALANAIDRLVADPAERTRLAEAGRARARALTPELFTGPLVEAIRRVAGESP
ncbi:MAG: glycosyltransferase family 4 protein [Candidatus Dormibacteria bacterium]